MAGSAACYCAAVAAASTAFRSCRMTAPGSAAPKMALPATMALAPAAAAASMVSGASPPSTCSGRGGEGKQGCGHQQRRHQIAPGQGNAVMVLQCEGAAWQLRLTDAGTPMKHHAYLDVQVWEAGVQEAHLQTRAGMESGQ